MYIPKSFEVTDRAAAEAFIAKHGFATLTTCAGGAPQATHLPLLLEGEALVGHMARANPHWRDFDGGGEALAIFHGPHGYISPSWYTTSPAVPTWNYAVVHVYGTPRLVDGEEALTGLVDRLVERYEAEQPKPWPGDLPADFKAGLLRAIVGFRMEITRIEAKFKLSQNRGAEDQRAVIARLRQGADPGERALGELMAEVLG